MVLHAHTQRCCFARKGTADPAHSDDTHRLALWVVREAEIEGGVEDTGTEVGERARKVAQSAEH